MKKRILIDYLDQNTSLLKIKNQWRKKSMIILSKL